MAYADSIRTTDYTREELATLIDDNNTQGITNKQLSNAVLTGGTQPNYTVTLTPAPTAYTQGMTFAIIINSTLVSLGGATLNVNGLGAKDLKVTTTGSGRRDPVYNELSARQVYIVTYEAALDSFQIANPTLASNFISYGPSVSSGLGTLSLLPTGNDNIYQYVSGSLIRVHWQLHLSLTGSTSPYILISLPQTPNANEANTFGIGYANAVSGYSSHGAEVFIFGNNARFSRTDTSNWPIDTDFYLFGTMIYNQST